MHDLVFRAVSRRHFARATALAAMGYGLHGVAAAQSTPSAAATKWPAAVIGFTGEGDYGHGLDVIFNDLPNVEVVAVADPDPSGRAKAAERCRALRQYADYREMLEKEKPRLVSLAARWTNHRLASGLAALRTGAHLYSEKPFATSLLEADELLATARKNNLKIAVAHQMRLAPSTLALKGAMERGLIGDLLELHAWGKQDDRAGGEDMIVLGSHLFDMMRFFAGDPEWCTARVLHENREITRNDARDVREKIGKVAGTDVAAQFAFPHGVSGTFTSRKRLRDTVGHWGLEFVGSKGSARLLTEIFPSIYLAKIGKWETTGRANEWRRWEGDPGITLSATERGFGPGNRRLVDDWLDAIAGDRQPICSGENAMRSIEMVMAVYQAALSRGRVTFPLADRRHPFGA